MQNVRNSLGNRKTSGVNGAGAESEIAEIGAILAIILPFEVFRAV